MTEVQTSLIDRVLAGVLAGPAPVIADSQAQ